MKFDKRQSGVPIFFTKEHTTNSNPPVVNINIGDIVQLRINEQDIFVRVSSCNNNRYDGLVEQPVDEPSLAKNQAVQFEIENVFSVSAQK